MDREVKKLIEMFPEIVAEDSDRERIKIDVSKLKEALKEYIEDDCERYELIWRGKSRSKEKIKEPIRGKKFRVIEEKSIDIESTKNIYIEGDNFDALKLLKNTHLNSIKIIYIDPPYNTGKNFIYNDTFREKFKKKGSYRGKKSYVDNHSGWLSMIYERLELSKELLRDDGVVFISIDDKELHNLKIIADEIFGESNFVTQFIRKTGVSARLDAKHISIESDYILMYAKSIDKLKLNREEAKNFDSYPFEDEFVDRRGRYKLNKLDRGSISYSSSLDYEIEAPDGTKIYAGGTKERNNWCWRWSKEKLKWGVENNFIVFKKRKGIWSVYFKQYQKVDNKDKPIKRETPYKNLLIKNFNNERATKEIKRLFNNKKVFDYPKPVDLIKHLLKIASTSKDDTILDFFSGTATTAQAVMELNIKDCGERRYIMVQIPEELNSKSVAYRSGFRTISDIGVERIIRASNDLKERFKDIECIEKLDFGFKYLKVDS